MSLTDYLQLLDWTAQAIVAGNPDFSPADVPPILERFSMEPRTWCELVRNFGRLFFNLAGYPQAVDVYRSPAGQRRFRLRGEARRLFATSA